MKLAYERPVMRAEMFQTNAYCGTCNRLPGETEEHTILKATERWGGKDALVFYFDLGTRVDGLSDSHGRLQHYYHEYSGTDYVGDNGTDQAGYGNNTYYLEWSVNNRDYYVYQENPNSGYSDTYKGSVSDGEKGLQINGTGTDYNYRDNATWNDHYQHGYYVADYSVTYGRGWDVTYENGSIVQYTASY